MSMGTLDRPAIVYPDSDGLPMADNTVQFRYIATIQGGIDALFRDDPNVFVAGDLFWYPVEGHPETRVAPDVLVAFGRPKGDRGSYKQWEEEGVVPQVVFEILSPSNTAVEMSNKLAFYQRYGVAEYYVFDPDRGELAGYQRHGEQLQSVPAMQGHVSPRLRIRFELVNGELHLYGPDGRRFPTYLELAAEREEAGRLAAQAQQQAEQERQRAERLAALLREHGIDPPN
jgi:Uma2 family endonuclease